MIDVPCPRDGYGVYETYGWNERHFTWGIDTLDGKMTVKLPKPYLGFISTEPYLEHDLLYNPNEEASALVSSYVTRHTNNPYRGVVISEHQELHHFCENLDQYGREALILRTRVDRHTGKRDPMCEKNTECDSLSESVCKTKSSSCTRQIGSSSNSKLQCVRQDGQPTTDADCTSIGDKPSCGGDSSSPTPEAECSSGWYRYKEESIWIQEVTYTDGEIICEELQGSKHHQPHQSLLQCDKYSLDYSNFTCPKMDKAIHHSLLLFM